MNIDPTVQTAIIAAIAGFSTTLIKPIIQYFTGKAAIEAKKEQDKENARVQEMKDLRNLLEDSKKSCVEKIDRLEAHYQDQMARSEKRYSEELERLRQKNVELQIQIVRLETRIEVTERIEKDKKVTVT